MSDEKRIAGGELEVEARAELLPQVLDFINERLEAADCPMKAQMQIAVAAEEIFVNIASYAYAPGVGMAKVCLEISGEPACMTLVFLDSGKPFDPTAMDDPDVTLPAEEREIGGLGIFMTKKFMDSVSYAYRDGKNVLTLKKTL